MCVCVCVCVCRNLHQSQRMGRPIHTQSTRTPFHTHHSHIWKNTKPMYTHSPHAHAHAHAHIRKTTRKHPRTRRGRYRPQMSPSLPSWIACSLLLFFCPSVFIVIVPDRTQTQKLCAGFFRDSTFRFLQSVPCGCMPLLCVRVCVCACVCCVDTSILVRGRGIKPLQS